MWRNLGSACDLEKCLGKKIDPPETVCRLRFLARGCPRGFPFRVQAAALCNNLRVGKGGATFFVQVFITCMMLVLRTTASRIRCFWLMYSLELTGGDASPKQKVVPRSIRPVFISRNEDARLQRDLKQLKKILELGKLSSKKLLVCYERAGVLQESRSRNCSAS